LSRQRFISIRCLAPSLATLIACTADFASSTHNSASTRQGQQHSGQQVGTKVIGPLPLLHIPKQNLESMRTCSPRPPHQNVLHSLQLRVLSRTRVAGCIHCIVGNVSSKYKSISECSSELKFLTHHHQNGHRQNIKPSHHP
jgi:hypothetical protein